MNIVLSHLLRSWRERGLIWPQHSLFPSRVLLAFMHDFHRSFTEKSKSPSPLQGPTCLKWKVSTIKSHTKIGFAILSLTAADWNFGRSWLAREGQCGGWGEPFLFPMGCLIWFNVRSWLHFTVQLFVSKQSRLLCLEMGLWIWHLQRQLDLSHLFH